MYPLGLPVEHFQKAVLAWERPPGIISSVFGANCAHADVLDFPDALLLQRRLVTHGAARTSAGRCV